jgi:hypothetical protein
MFVEHQSTSGTKIHNPGACTRAVLLSYLDTEITVAIVIIRNYKTYEFDVVTFSGYGALSWMIYFDLVHHN